MSQCQKSINFKGPLSAQHPVTPPTAFPGQSLCTKHCSASLRHGSWWKHLNQTTCDPCSRRTALVYSSVKATEPTLSRAAVSPEHFGSTEAPAAASQLTLLCCSGVTYTSHRHSRHCNVYVPLGVGPV